MTATMHPGPIYVLEPHEWLGIDPVAMQMLATTMPLESAVLIMVLLHRVDVSGLVHMGVAVRGMEK